MLTKVIFQKFERHRKINHSEVHLNWSISIAQWFFLKIRIPKNLIAALKKKKMAKQKQTASCLCKIT